MLPCQLCPGHLWVVRGYPVGTPAPSEHPNTQWAPSGQKACLDSQWPPNMHSSTPWALLDPKGIQWSMDTHEQLICTQ